MDYSDDLIRDLLSRVKTIALVGYSANPARASHRVAAFLHDRGYRVIPVNPGLAGQVHLGETVVASLAQVTVPVDMVDIFRNSEAAGDVVDDALAQCPGLSAIWMQLGVVNPAAANRAEAQGVTVIMDRCPKIEIARLGL